MERIKNLKMYLKIEPMSFCAIFSSHLLLTQFNQEDGKDPAILRIPNLIIKYPVFQKKMFLCEQYLHMHVVCIYQFKDLINTNCSPQSIEKLWNSLRRYISTKRSSALQSQQGGLDSKVSSHSLAWLQSFLKSGVPVIKSP